MQARVTVVQSLPLLEPRLHAPPPALVPAAQPDASSTASNTPEGTPKSSSAAASPSKPEGPRPLQMAALKGQVLHWAMLLSNAGESPSKAHASTTLAPFAAQAHQRLTTERLAAMQHSSRYLTIMMCNDLHPVLPCLIGTPPSAPSCILLPLSPPLPGNYCMSGTSATAR